MTLEVTALDVSYGSVRAVRGATLVVNDGEAVALIGSNGAGKSSLLRAISGMHPTAGGTVSYQGRRITGAPSHSIATAGVGHVPEGRRLFARMTVRENLQLGAFRRRDSHVAEDLESQLALFPRLGERLDQEAGTLSGGEQQMVAIGRALMARPTLLLLDEPSLGLSPLMMKTVFKAIEEIHKNGVSVLLVEQNATKALALASRGYVMTAGEIVAEGSSRSLRDDDRVREMYLGQTAVEVSAMSTNTPHPRSGPLT